MVDKKKVSLDEKFKRLEEIKQKIQSGVVNIDDIVPLVEEANALYKDLNKGLESVRKILSEKEKES
tara:strand:+ start:1625 stop:1822 length:198 start_codon:yes stop_codon:yes gene_type:complete